jgi:hypothetical protein
MKDQHPAQRPAWEPPWVGRVVLGHGFGRQEQASAVVPEPAGLEVPDPEEIKRGLLEAGAPWLIPGYRPPRP